MPEQEYEYRAIYRTQTSIISKPDALERGYEERPTGPYPSMAAAMHVATRRMDEDLGWVAGYERRPVGAWEPVPENEADRG